MGIRKDINSWKRLTDKITTTWVKEYFELTSADDSSVDWVADDVGTIFEFADYFFDFNTVLKCYELDISKENLFLWYDFCLSNHSVNISLAKFILSPEDKKKAEEKHLEELKGRVEQAEKKKKKALNNLKM